jgi:nucleotide-binding universal stress UspA family protein
MDECHMSYKRIMVAVDGSATSDLALNEAILLTKAFHSQLCIIHVVQEFPPYGVEWGFDLNRFQEILRNDGQAILDKAKKIVENEGVSAEIQLIEIFNALERISEKIVEVAGLWKADLLVIGTHGRRGFNRLILGSVAEETIRLSQIPIHLIRAKEPAL